MKVRASLEPLRERPFRLLFLGRSLSGVGDSIVPVAVTFAVLDHGTVTDVGIVQACNWAARLAFLLVGGVWADRLPRQLVMVGADVLRATVQALLAAAFFTHSVAIWQLALASGLAGVGSSFFNPASTGLVPEIVSAGRLQEANALLGLSRSAIDIAGPVLSGVIVATLGFGIVFAIDAASFVASFLCLVAMRLPARVVRGARKSMVAEALEGIAEVRARRWILIGLAADLVFNFAFAAYFVLGPAVVKTHFGGARDWGLMMTTGAVGALAAGAFVLRVRPRRPFMVCYPLGLAMPLTLVALAVPLPLPALLVGAGLIFFNVVVLNTFWVTLEQQHVPNELLSRVDSLVWMASVLVMPLSLGIVGPVADAVGLRAALLGSAALGAAGVVGALAFPEFRNVERVDSEPEAEAEARPAPA